MRLKAKAAAEAVNTEKLSGLFIPIEKVIDKANSSKRIPLNCANNFVLNPTIRQIAKTNSAVVARIPIVGIMKFGSHGFIFCV